MLCRFLERVVLNSYRFSVFEYGQGLELSDEVL